MTIRTGIFALALAAASLAATAQDTGLAPTRSPAEADARLAEVAKGRAAADAQFADSEQLCYTKFFVNSCLDKAKEKRRAALAGLRAIENEASHFKRAYSVAQRDQALAAQQDEANKAERVPPKAPPVPAKPQAGRPDGKTPARRLAEHEAKVNARQAQDAAGAAKRAANVAAFEKKQHESAERQREIAAKQAAEKARKDAAAAAAAASAAAAEAKKK